ncbi:MAG TPA: hypothetical protein VE685_02110 [Thermoanaerobaculia bacterium]|nr:hypothetical protein [Thermoanaerobaculia bacterium]
MNARSLLMRLFLVIAGFSLWLFLIRSEPIRFGAHAVPEEPGLGALVFGYLVTVVGVVLGSFYRELKRRQEQGITSIDNFRAYASSVVRSIDLWMGLFASPLVYALILKTTDGASLSGVTIIGLENGFFCTLVLEAATRRQQQQHQVPTEG